MWPKRERGTLVVQEGRDPPFFAQIPCSRPNVGDGGWTWSAKVVDADLVLPTVCV